MTMPSTFGTLKTRLGQRLHMSQTTDLTRLGDIINDAGQEVWLCHAWPERVNYKTVQTKATVTISGGITASAGDAAFVTTSGVDYSAATYSGAKVVRGGVGNPQVYVIDTASSGVNDLDVDRPIEEAVAAEDASIVWDEYSLASDVHTLLSGRVNLLDADGRALGNINPVDAHEHWPYPTASGAPYSYYLLPHSPLSSEEAGGSLTTDVMRIRIGPAAPDAIYTIRYGYLAKWTELTTDGQTPIIAKERLPLVLECAAWRAYQEFDEYRDTDLAERQEARYMRQLRKEIARASGLKPSVVYVRPIDRPVRRQGLHFILPPET